MMKLEARATYRVQLTPDFDLDCAAELASYFAQLGISHLYCSPYLQAAAGSQHGYDVVDYHRISSQLGGQPAHQRLCTALAAQGLGQLLDIVPNHMAISGRDNPWWWDVLENGPSSNYATYFDVEWDPPESRLRNLVLLPVLGGQYGRVLDAGEIRLSRQGARFVVSYFEHTFPVAPRSLDSILAGAAAQTGSAELGFIADALGSLPRATATDRQSVRRRHRDKAVLEVQLARLLAEQPAVASAIDRMIEAINRHPDSLHALLERQNYRLALWRTAGRDLGYRRFFDVNTLVGLRVEDEQVFADTHEAVLNWLRDGSLDGVRVDHIDGLREPQAYLERLHTLAPQAWIVVEKILQAGEELRASWPTAGTTGYEFANLVGGLWIDPAGETEMTRHYVTFSGEQADFATVARHSRELVLRDLLGSELGRLTALWLDICEHDRHHRDHTRHELHEALKAVAARFPVYRTYVSAAQDQATREDRQYINEAIQAARGDHPELDPELLDFLRSILSGQRRGGAEMELALRFQQFSGAVMAKAIEDTAFYRYNRLVALNEVGGDPACFGVGVAQFHQACLQRQQHWPGGLLATTTHDTKRSEDVRARISLLSEIPRRWSERSLRWAEHNQRHWRVQPDRNAEYLYYQTLVGAWPIETERITAYMMKAVREAKQRTSWTQSNPEYEQALKEFVAGTLSDPQFTDDVAQFVGPLVEPGRINSLAQTLLKLTAPGIPDLYQGSELWDLSLVDPDNRRPVDYAARRAALDTIDRLSVAEILRRSDEGLPKLWTIVQALRLRRRHPSWLAPQASYEPIQPRGRRAAHVVGFVRGQRIAAIVPRLIIGVGGQWHDTTARIMPGHWRNVLDGEELSGGELALSELFRRFPVALLVREDHA
ncbi:MAG TPA: malto-oligosyltrehalose synthase [Candidatus Binataceae bacterium]|nr:malto-oligosyltrehalose synthase [Candidatus Binataceae bacterium]